MISLKLGDCVDVMRRMPEAFVDAVVCDPPYDLVANKKGGSGAASVNLESPYGRSRIGTGNGAGGFMGKEWDSTGVAFDPETWRAALRVLKPGGHVLAFGGTRTYHRLTCAIEDAGFEIRDCIMWLYGSGFPKSHNLHGEWEGWGTALKPAYEPIVVARKSLIGTVAKNVLAHGTGALNIDACRITSHGSGSLAGPSDAQQVRRCEFEPSANRRYTEEGGTSFAALPGVRGGDPMGRWPANVMLDEEAAAMLDAQTSVSASSSPRSTLPSARRAVFGQNAEGGFTTMETYGDRGGASRFFYCPKTSKSERNAGVGKNDHPTVKPIAVMRYLIKLVTPPGGTVLDPFLGSGTTALAALEEGMSCIGIEREAHYLDIARERVGHAGAKSARSLHSAPPLSNDMEAAA